jgi:predicted TPR repeat methyltransferase
MQRPDWPWFMNRQQRRRDAKTLRKAAKMARATEPTNTRDAFEAAKLLKHARKFQEAEALYGRILAIEPDNWEAHNNLGNLLADRGDFAGAAAAYQRALTINPDYADGHNNLGTVLRETGDLDGAATCYRRALEINTDHAGAHFNLGTALLDQKKPEEANAAYRRAASLGNEAARHMLDSMTGGAPESAPRNYVTGLFDDYAEGFEKSLVEDLDYRVPSFLRTRLQAVLPAGTRFFNAVDLGCGSGLVGVEFRPLVERLTGVDLSPGMLEKSKEKKIYDELVKADITEFLAATEARYDLFTAADLFVYLGNLESLFSTVRRAATEEAWFAFSTESMDGADFRLNETGRYTHSRGYIEVLARRYDFTIRSCQAKTIRQESGRPVAGDLFVLQHMAGAEQLT